MKSKALATIKFVLLPIVLLAFSLAVWFVGPMIAVGSVAPLGGLFVRTAIIALIWAVFLSVLFWRYRQKKKAARLLEEAVAPRVETGDTEQLSERMSDALATRRARPSEWNG